MGFRLQAASVETCRLLPMAIVILACCALPSCSSGNGSGPAASTGGNGHPTTSSGAGGQMLTGGASARGGSSGAAGGIAGTGGAASVGGATAGGGQGGLGGMLGTDLYVSPTGDDANPGTITSPLKTLDRARLVVRANKGSMGADIHVYLRAGRYELAAPLVFDAGDSGTNESYINYMAYDGEQPVVSGGKMVTG
jgi:hypothetical protein